MAANDSILGKKKQISLAVTTIITGQKGQAFCYQIILLQSTFTCNDQT